jgi:hypothetical protein
MSGSRLEITRSFLPRAGTAAMLKVLVSHPELLFSDNVDGSLEYLCRGTFGALILFIEV